MKFDSPAAINSGFEIVTPCIFGCYLYAREERSSDRWMKAAPLDGSVKRFQAMTPPELAQTAVKKLRHSAAQHGDMLLYIDSVSAVGEADTPLQTKLNSKKLRILQRIGAFYQKGAPVLCLLTLLWFLGLVVQLWRTRGALMPLVMTGLILVLMLNRVAALALVDVIAFRVSDSAEYAQYSYPLVLMVIGLMLLNPAAPFRPRTEDR